MSLSPAQRKFYFAGKYQAKTEVEKLGPWPALCELRGWDPKNDDKRYAAHEAIGLPASIGDWTNRDFNRFLTYVEKAWAATHGRAGSPSQPTSPPRDRDRENALHTIRHSGFDEAYVRKIARDRFGLACYEELALPDLIQLRNTIANRRRTAASKGSRVTSGRAEPAVESSRTEAARTLAAVTGYEEEEEMPF